MTSPRKRTATAKAKKKPIVELQSLPLVALRDIVVFPYMVIPLFIGRKKSLHAVDKSMASDRRLVLVTQNDAGLESPRASDLFHTGCLAEILQLLKLPDGSYKILIEGKSRVNIESIHSRRNGFEADVQPVTEPENTTLEIQALQRTVVDQFEHYIKLNRKIPVEIMMVIMNTEDTGRLADIIIAHLPLTVQVKQDLLEAVNVKKRLEMLAMILNREIEILSIEKKIRGRVKEQIEQVQKEYYLREQIKAIQKELGSDEDLTEEVDKLRQQLKEIKSISDESRALIHKEIDRYERTHFTSAESGVIRSYLDLVLELPWDRETSDRLDINLASKLLNRDHYGLERVKERILEFLAVRQRVTKSKGPILCLVGPPGVGKTSLGRSIAGALKREFVRISLGGVRDEAEIRGHRRTYVGAMAGKIIQALHRAKTRNPLFLLDEVDKLANDFRGDPTSALLEVLDPEQNGTFTDHYVNLPFDLTNVFFVTTANVLHTVPPALRDRMEVIRLPGYTEDEKRAIARRHLLPKQLKENGLTAKHLLVPNNSLLEIIRRYTREAGVRNLERELGSICRKRVRTLVGEKLTGKVSVKPSEISNYLGIPRFSHGVAEKQALVGTVNGLAWTEVGGVVLIVEAAQMTGKGVFTVTGQVGDVMQESAKAALTWIRSRAEQLKIDPRRFAKLDFHIHVPEGATPKDGPSAGVALLTALVSLLTNRPARADLAMTGEITLRGRILAVGGIKEKVLAAVSEGIPEVILPRENEKDLEDIPETLRSAIRYRFVDWADEVIETALM